MTNKIYRISNWILSCLLTVVGAYASPGNKAKTFDIKDGLPSINISQVRQDDNGLIWIGTWNGLAFFNGEHFYTFRSDDIKGRLSTNRIHSLMPDSLENVWFLTYDRKLNMLDKDKGRFISISEFLPEGTELPPLQDLYRTKNGIWVASSDKKSVVKITYVLGSPDEYAVELLSTSDLMPGSTKFKEVLSVVDGESWIVTDEKTFLEGTNLAISGNVIGIAESDGKSYLVTERGDMTSLQGHQLKEETSLNDFGKITGVVKINDTNIGVSTTQGYAVYNLKTRKWQKYDIKGGIIKIFGDSNNHIWMFGENGEVWMSSGVASPIAVPSEPSLTQGTAFLTPMIYEDRYGTVWLAQENRQLGYYDETKKKIVPTPVIVPKLKYEALPMVEKYFVDHNGDLWLISTSGLSFVNFTYHNFKNLPLEANNETRSVLATRDGTLLAGSVNGVLAKYNQDGKLIGYLSHTPIGDAGGNLLISPEYKTFSNRIYALHEDIQGNLWVGTKDSGLYTISPEGRVVHYSPNNSGQYHIDSNVFYGFDTDAKGRLWIGSYDKGPYIASMNPDGTASFTALSDLPGFPKEEGFKQVRRITHNDEGLIAMSTNAGMLMVKDDFKTPSEIRFTTLCPDFTDKESLSTANVMQTLFTKNGYALVSPMGGEVQRIDNEDLMEGKMKFKKPASEELSRVLSRGNVQSMIEDSAGNFYFVRDTDIVRYSPSDSTINILGSGVLGEDYEF